MADVSEVITACPDCGSKVWDNREDKRSPKAPDFKCRSNGDHAFWLKPKNGNGRAHAAPSRQAISMGPTNTPFDEPQPYAAPNGDRLAAGFATYARCLDHARVEVIRTGLDKLGGDVAGAVAAIAATLYIQASK